MRPTSNGVDDPEAGLLPHDRPWARRLDVVVQRASWIVLPAIIGLAFSGTLGGGDRITIDLTSAGSESREILREGRTISLELTFPSPTGADRCSVSIDETYLRVVRVLRVVPQPIEERLIDGAREYVLTLQPGRTDVCWRIDMEPNHPGPLRGVCRAGERSVTLRHFVLP